MNSSVHQFKFHILLVFRTIGSCTRVVNVVTLKGTCKFLTMNKKYRERNSFTNPRYVDLHHENLKREYLSFQNDEDRAANCKFGFLQTH